MNTLTQNQAILKHLKKGKRITSLTALKLFGCLRLSGRIYDLKKAGHDILSRMVTRNGKHVKEYRLAQS